MSRYLSDEWLGDVRAALAGSDALRDVLPRRTVVVQHTVTGGPTGHRVFQVALDRDAVDVTAGAPAAADVRFTSSYEVASAIARGALSAQAAFMDGSLRVGGDLGALADEQRALQGVDDVLRSVRASTTY